ncbi:ABC-2 type transport system permease protein [Lentzea fradiae]|uniref:ABC-2 type transport system permease protein n=1 Tax=Lentzea fradiae TaxID=200378 RepID=A0A1G7P0G4_9PSEU|nr:ABC transporter permease [Lentzea fradiae]SDF79792.1 ABC-2 type transport system permease protein [Lentzea fradiae]
MARTSFAQATWLVAEREMRTFLTTKGFWIGFIVTIAGLFALTVLPTAFGGDDPKVAVVGSASRVVEGKPLDVREVATVEEATELVRSDDVEAAIVPDGAGVKVVALNDPPSGVISQLVDAPPVELLEPSEVSSAQRSVTVIVFGLVFLMFGMGGAAIAQSTVTEKQTRIVEILVSTVPVRALLAGKILGHVILTLAQVVVLALVAPIALRVAGLSELLAVVVPALGWFVPFLMFGFVLVSSMWAVAGALVSRQEDLGSTMGLVMLAVMGPYFAVQIFFENPAVLAVMSYVPFTAGIAMPVRMFAQQAQAWEALVSLGILAATVAVILLVASRLYTGSLLQTGGRVKLSKAWAPAE